MKRLFRLKFILLLLLMATFNSPAYADEPDIYNDSYFKPTFYSSRLTEKIIFPRVLTIGGGAVSSDKAGQSQSFPIQNPPANSFYDYDANNSFQTTGLFTFFFGNQWQLPLPYWSLQAGVEYAQTWNFSASGNLTQEPNVHSESNYTYSYNIRSRQVLAKMKVAYAYTADLFPYVSLGIGPAFNSAANFVTSAPPLVAITRQYANHTQTSFSYTVGVGVDCALTEQVRLGLGYQFVNFGKSQLGNATINNKPVSGSLSQSTFYANELVGQLTFLLDHKPSKSDPVKWS